MPLPEIGQTISEQEFNIFPTVGETITEEQFNALPDSVSQQPKGGFLQRLRLSFGGKKAQEERATIEQAQGVAGRFDVGDIADVAGKALPFTGSVIGGVLGTGAGGVGAVPGAALGASGGEAIRRFTGKLIGAPSDTAGEDIKEIAKEGAYTYAGGKVLQGAGRLAAKTGVFNKLPERIYSTFFKTTSDDLANLAKTGAIQNLQQTNPDLFQQLVKEGIVKTGKTGAVEINPTLAQEALARGFGGKGTGRSLENMARYSVEKQLELELQARHLARSINTPTKLENAKGYLNMLRDVSDAFKREGYGFLSKTAKEADDLAKIIQKGNNKISVEDKLKLRRLIDSMRNTSSFKDSPTLSQKQAVFKVGADKLRKELAEVPGMKDIMNEYRFNIEAADSLVREAARRGNNRIFGLFDAVVGGTSIGAFGVPGVGLLATARTIQTPAVLTAIARGLKGVPQLTKKALPYLAEPTGQGIKRLFRTTSP